MAVFYSFHYEHDVMRVQQVRNMGVLDGQPLLNAQKWEEVRRAGKAAIEQWIDKQMAYKEAVVVLVGAETADRPWVQYEIEKAWADKKPLVGIRIHGLANLQGQTDRPGVNPFTKIRTDPWTTLDQLVPLQDPAGANSSAVYQSIQANLKTWVDNAVRRR
ncbi:TIR domain-containing protein [Amycolatopsis sp. OK19-0408]|uniref:TIR domain-containing protein n=1 Tax=Amycolatopsis iheyensis TaxID=2945988 RepID=A0A9X2NH51_9PSEU|nr:TIR domain-containing protein [Amycolatopsis iheyensis]MCR6488639.1 TIR domain-containing protein [Amycolatopsis iheyensis]